MSAENNIITVDIEEMQRDLSGYLKRVSEGETVLILQGDTPVAELKPVTPNARQQRPFGLCPGEFTVPEDFDEPLPETILAELRNQLAAFAEDWNAPEMNVYDHYDAAKSKL